MNPTLVCLFFALASWHLSADCSDLEFKLKALELQLKQGYRLNELPKLQRQQQLLSSRFQRCLDQQQAKSAQHNQARPAKTPARSNMPSGPAFSASQLQLSGPYQGEQQQAWLQYYQPPERCYGVRDTAQIVWCAEQRQQARTQFDRQWQQKLAQSRPE